MKVEADGDLKELMETGTNQRYKNIVRNKELFDGFHRAVDTMKAAENIEVLKNISFFALWKQKMKNYTC
ncbi:MAG: hypothetical protein IKH89_01520 [Bacteroidales bacterium]|nr:hypothetical protein [Bacteroidales bacterium]